MPQSLACILVHVVFSTKNREPFLRDEERDSLHAFIGGVVRQMNGTLLDAASVSDHIHLLISHPRTAAPADLVQDIKAASSKWLKTQAPRYAPFHWQSGYGAFSVSPSHRKKLGAYFAAQKTHHQDESFQDEYRRLLHKYEIEYDERYVWD